MMRITIIGAGNVATNLALALKKAGHQLVQIYNRSNDAGQELARAVAASFTSDSTQLADADVYIVAVKDDVIEEVASQINLYDKVIVHTSGTKSKDLLKKSSSCYGIFYPLQTMTKGAKVDFRNVPLLIEGNNETTVDKLSSLACSISQNVHRVDEEQRQWIHIAAVFANNFTNHLYTISDKILKEHQLSFSILKPLIFRSVENLNHHSPDEIQTGPASRKDLQVIEKHLSMLADNPDLQKMYELLSNSIIASTGKGEN